MSISEDTIVAVSTPIGMGGIGIVRLSGPDALTIADAMFVPARDPRVSGMKTHTMKFGRIIDPKTGAAVDEVLVSVMKAPNSYTREDVAEINCHGGMVSVRKIFEIAASLGARPSGPGEFTRRAFVNGRIPLEQAEAVMDLISAGTEQSLRIAAGQLEGGLSKKLGEIREKMVEICVFAEAYIDFPEDEIDVDLMSGMIGKLRDAERDIHRLSQTFAEARFFRDGLSVAIVGRPNVGKSSLLNALLMKDRAIVSDMPGTTRDIIEEYLDVGGLPVRIVDTAGIRASEERIEIEGIRRSLKALKEADFVVLVLDGSEELRSEDHELLSKISGINYLVCVNKSDLPVKTDLSGLDVPKKRIVGVSALDGKGLDDLKSMIYDFNMTGWKPDAGGVVITNLRHKTLLDASASALDRACGLLEKKEPIELVSIEIRDAISGIGEITGEFTTEEILDGIFGSFCIGK